MGRGFLAILLCVSWKLNCRGSEIGSTLVARLKQSLAAHAHIPSCVADGRLYLETEALQQPRCFLIMPFIESLPVTSASLEGSLAYLAWQKAIVVFSLLLWSAALCRCTIQAGLESGSGRKTCGCFAKSLFRTTACRGVQGGGSFARSMRIATLLTNLAIVHGSPYRLHKETSHLN